MINITTIKGEVYSFDPETKRLFLEGKLIPSSKVEPIYSNTSDPNDPPRFSGILFKESKEILTLSGKINQVTDINSVS